MTLDPSSLGWARRGNASCLWLLAILALADGTALGAAQRLLIYQRNGPGYVHDNLAASAAALREIASQQHLEADVSTNASVFAGESLKRYAAVIFANSNNDACENAEQRAAFRKYIESGGGFIGIHSSTGSERNWPWFQQMQGAGFLRHPPLQTFTVKVADPAHPATAHLPSPWVWTDECYFFTNLNQNIRVLLTLDAASLRDPKLPAEPGETIKGEFPLAWRQEQYGGRQFYTALGHRIEHYSDPAFRQHLSGAIRWVIENPKTP